MYSINFSPCMNMSKTTKLKMEWWNFSWEQNGSGIETQAYRRQKIFSEEKDETQAYYRTVKEVMSSSPSASSTPRYKIDSLAWLRATALGHLKKTRVAEFFCFSENLLLRVTLTKRLTREQLSFPFWNKGKKRVVESIFLPGRWISRFFSALVSERKWQLVAS